MRFTLYWIAHGRRVVSLNDPRYGCGGQQQVAGKAVRVVQRSKKHVVFAIVCCTGPDGCIHFG